MQNLSDVLDTTISILIVLLLSVLLVGAFGAAIFFWHLAMVTR